MQTFELKDQGKYLNFKFYVVADSILDCNKT